MATVHIFVSYSHEDARWLEEGSPQSLMPRLAKSLEREGGDIWYDKKRLGGGDPWREEIEKAIDKAHIAILLVSQNFLISDFIRDFELPQIESRAEGKEIVVVPILVGPCDWQSVPLLNVPQMLPGKPTPLVEYLQPLSKWERVQYEIFTAVKRQIQKVRSRLEKERAKAVEIPVPDEVSEAVLGRTEEVTLPPVQGLRRIIRWLSKPGAWIGFGFVVATAVAVVLLMGKFGAGRRRERRPSEGGAQVARVEPATAPAEARGEAEKPAIEPGEAPEQQTPKPVQPRETVEPPPTPAQPDVTAKIEKPEALPAKKEKGDEPGPAETPEKRRVPQITADPEVRAAVKAAIDSVELLEEEFDADIVREALTLIAVSRHGITERELQELVVFREVLQRLEESKLEAVREAISIVAAVPRGLTEAKLQRLVEEADPQSELHAVLGQLRPCPDLFVILRQLRSYLLKRGELVDFYHQNLEKAVCERYLADEDTGRGYHKKLARYFHTKGKEYVRTLSELPYHQTSGEMWDELERTLTDLRFIEAKCVAGLTYELVADYLLALDAGPEGPFWSGRRRVSEFALFVRRHAHIFQSSPATPFQLAYNSGVQNMLSEAAERALGRGERPSYTWIRILNRDERSQIAPWDLVLSGHTDRVPSMDIADTGSLAVSGSRDGTVRFWDVETGQCTHVGRRHNDEVLSVSLAEKAGLAVSLDRSGLLVLWDSQLGVPRWEVQIQGVSGHGGGAAGISGDGETIVISKHGQPGPRMILEAYNVSARKLLWEAEMKPDVPNLSASSVVVSERAGVVLRGDGCSRRQGGTSIVSAWGLETGERLWLKLYTEGGDAGTPWRCTNVAFDASGLRVFSRGETVRAHDIKTGEALWEVKHDYLAYTRSGSEVSMPPFCATAKKVVCPGQDGRRAVVVVLDADSGDAATVFPSVSGCIHACCADRAGERVLVSSGTEIFCMNITSPLETVSRPPSEKDRLGALDASALDRRLANLAGDPQLRPETVRSMAGGGWIVAGACDSNVPVFDMLVEYAKSEMHDPEVESWLRHESMLSVEGRWAIRGRGGSLIGAGNGRLFRVDLKAKRPSVMEWTAHKAPGGPYPASFACLVVSPDGRNAVSGANDGMIAVWDIAVPDRKLFLAKVRSTPGAMSGPRPTFAVTPDGRSVVTPRKEVWDINAKTQTEGAIQTWAWGYSIAISPDSLYAAAACNGILSAWPVGGGNELWSTQIGNVRTSIAWSPNGLLLLMVSTTGNGGMLQVRASRTGEILAECPLPGLYGERKYRISVGPDSKTVAVQDSWSREKVWFMRIENLKSAPPIVSARQRQGTEALATLCPFCHMWFDVNSDMLAHETNCPNEKCRQRLRLNAFVIRTSR